MKGHIHEIHEYLGKISHPTISLHTHSGHIDL